MLTACSASEDEINEIQIRKVNQGKKDSQPPPVGLNSNKNELFKNKYYKIY